MFHFEWFDGNRIMTRDFRTLESAQRYAHAQPLLEVWTIYDAQWRMVEAS